MKKTFQKEMKAASPAPMENGHTSSDRSGSTPTPPLLQHSPTASGSFDAAQLVLSPTAMGLAGANFPPVSDSSSVVSMTEVNFKYLKHVIFKFFTSREYEVSQRCNAVQVYIVYYKIASTCRLSI